jgi:hypothetical protein
MENRYDPCHDQKIISINKRIFPLDILKAVSIIAVVSYHSIFIPRSSYQSSVFLLEIIFSPLRFCVPVLFTISFILLSREVEKTFKTSLWKILKIRLQRLAIPAIFWFGLTCALRLLNKGSISDLIPKILSGTIFQGSYFLIALFELTPIFIFLGKKIFDSNFLLGSLFLQVVLFEFIQHGLIYYSDSDVIKILRMIDRPFFMYWFSYMLLGAFIWKKWARVVAFSKSVSTITKSVLCILGCTSIILEQYHILKASDGGIPPFDYVMISCILSIFILFTCFASIQEERVPVFLRTLILVLSKYSLGIFCINGILSEIFLSIGFRLFKDYMFSFPEILTIKLISWAILLSSCLGISIFLDKIGLRTVVR